VRNSDPRRSSLTLVRFGTHKQLLAQERRRWRARISPHAGPVCLRRSAKGGGLIDSIEGTYLASIVRAKQSEPPKPTKHASAITRRKDDHGGDRKISDRTGPSADVTLAPSPKAEAAASA
jgi:hypothetical protein